jgi:hypothetical protein
MQLPIYYSVLEIVDLTSTDIKHFSDKGLFILP